MTHATTPTTEPTQTASAIRCADCLYCKRLKEFSRSGKTYIEKVRCSKGNWRRGKNDHLAATYDLHTLLARRVQKCPEYESLSENDEDRDRYLAELRDNLPLEKYVFNADGTYADMGAEQWHATT